MGNASGSSVLGQANGQRLSMVTMDVANDASIGFTRENITNSITTLNKLILTESKEVRYLLMCPAYGVLYQTIHHPDPPFKQLLWQVTELVW